MTPAEAYRVLGVEPDCDERELTHRFRRLAQETHPDAGGSQTQFRELAHAFAVASSDRAGREPPDTTLTTHVTSLSGRVRRFRREVRRRVRGLPVDSRHPHPNGGRS